MKSEDILNQLALLDPEDDSQWTKDGQPLLSLFGDDVTRADVIAAAPHFNRKNPVLPEESPEPVSTEPSIEEIQAQIKAEKEAVESEISAIQKQVNLLQEQIKEKNKKVQQLSEAYVKADYRSDTEINQEFLRADFENRLKKARQREFAAQLLMEAGIPHKDVSMYKLGPADRAIASANIRKRQDALRKP